MKRLAKRHSFKPTLETLETRWCPTASITTPLEHTVTVTGDDNANAVQIIQNDDQNTLIIITESAFRVFASDRVENVVINLNGGKRELFLQNAKASCLVNREFLVPVVATCDGNFNGSSEVVGFAIIEIGGFDQLKETLGSGDDDDFLAEIAERLRAAMPRHAAIGRLRRVSRREPPLSDLPADAEGRAR